MVTLSMTDHFINLCLSRAHPNLLLFFSIYELWMENANEGNKYVKDMEEENIPKK
jgi:hypothetical protein